MLFSGKKEKDVEKLIFRHIEVTKATLQELGNMLSDYLKKDQSFKKKSYNVHKLEHQADIIRREAEMKLYQGAFLPIYREDYIILMDLIDKIANCCELAADELTITRPVIPEFITAKFYDLVSITVDAFDPLENMFRMLEDNTKEVISLSIQVEEKEAEVDRLAFEINRAVFKSQELELAEKMLLKCLVQKVAAISNKIEDVSDRFEIMVAKRAF